MDFGAVGWGVVWYGMVLCGMEWNGICTESESHRDGWRSVGRGIGEVVILVGGWFGWFVS